jgi:serine/threonine-protein kinase
MEFIGGPDLATLLLREGVFDPHRAAGLMAGVARGLEAIHRDGILHRDLKPHNVLVAPGERAVIADFGVARMQRNTRLTMTGQLVGSPAYMAPETFDERPATAAVDLYALGAMLYELLTGQPPFVGSDTIHTLRRIREEPHAPLPDRVPPSLRQIVDRLLAKEPGQRYARATALAQDLEAVAARGHAAAPL